MSDTAYIIQQLDSARSKVLALLDGLDRQQELYPGWTIKHFLAHLTGWDEAVTDSLRAYVSGDESIIPAYSGIDDYNARSVSTRQNLDYNHIYREWEQAREQLKAAIYDIPAEELGKVIVFPWGERGTVSQMVAIIYHHEAEHAEELGSLLNPEEPD